MFRVWIADGANMWSFFGAVYWSHWSNCYVQSFSTIKEVSAMIHRPRQQLFVFRSWFLIPLKLLLFAILFDKKRGFGYKSKTAQTIRSFCQRWSLPHLNSNIYFQDQFDQVAEDMIVGWVNNVITRFTSVTFDNLRERFNRVHVLALATK